MGLKRVDTKTMLQFKGATAFHLSGIDVHNQREERKEHFQDGAQHTRACTTLCISQHPCGLLLLWSL